MKNIEIDEELYQYIASNTQFIGESASSILRRLLSIDTEQTAPKEAVDELVANKVEQVPSEPEQQVQHEVEPQEKESVFNYINKEELAMQRGAVGRFLLILAALYRVHQHSFSVVSEIRGRDRLYFARSESELTASGSSTKPRQIPDSPFWVITNSNTTRKKMMLTEAAISLGYDESDAEKIRELL